MAPHSSTLAWKIPWTEKPGRLQSMGSLRPELPANNLETELGSGSSSPLSLEMIATLANSSTTPLLEILSLRQATQLNPEF